MGRETKIPEVFGRLVVEKRRTRLADLKEFPRYVLEYLINQFCPGDDFEAELGRVRRKLAENYASPADAPRILHELKQKRSLDLIARVEVRLETSEDKYWAQLAALNERHVHVDEGLVNKYPRLMGGMWGIAELTYDEAQVWKGKITPLLLSDFTPFQHGRIDISEFLEKRSQFTRDEWLALLVNTIGLNPEVLSFRQQLLTILRLVPMAERMVHLIELGPRETGKSYGYKNLSYYSYMLSGGRATPAALFVHGGTGKPGLVAQFDTLVFDEIANTEFKDPTATVSIFKDYMEYGNFSLGRFQVKGEASIVFIGNLDVLGNQPHEKYDHLFEPLPEELVDTALFERIHGFLPGWEMPKLTDKSFAEGYGFTLDYFAELLHLLRGSLLPTDPSTRYVLRNAKGRDVEAIHKVVRGLMKLLHPDGRATDEELAEYVAFAVEARQRVKDQLSVLAPGEYPKYTMEFEIAGKRTLVEPPERARRRSLRIPSEPQVGVVVGLAVGGDGAGSLQVIEVVAQKGNGALHRLGSMGKSMKESVKAAYEYVSHRRKSLQIVSELKGGYDLSVLALQGAIAKEGPSAGLAFAVGIVSALTHRKVRNDVAMTGEITLHGNILGIGGVAPKIAAARDAGARVVILPKENEREVRELPADVCRGVQLVFVEKAEEALKEVLV
ncbi:BREX system Lon protease-like protein BrxL [Archangium violaceum]|uniref:BREX system Lon protease-like protein BrxL n=1 Tax=Archangium violaceum TaxID=83451 RepID=UPI0019502ED4|nr:BREX system Lon protease-like protein BrxL [Archangium violaceum]QRN94040.1 BREX system Lon protease-like protein BrxL [Archangium violaceum]